MIHIAEKLFQCDKCDKSFKYRPTLLSHLAKEHEGGLPHKCQLCGKAFLNGGKLQMHNLRVHKALEGKINVKSEEKNDNNTRISNICELCGKNYSDAYKLKYHKLEIHDGRTFDCTKCENVFRHKYLLQEHIKAIHEGIKFKCLSCGKEFDRKQTMQSHVRYVHTMQRNFPCEFCPYRSAQGADLKKHIDRIHKNNTTNKNYSFLWKKIKEE